MERLVGIPQDLCGLCRGTAGKCRQAVYKHIQAGDLMSGFRNNLVISGTLTLGASWFQAWLEVRQRTLCCHLACFWCLQNPNY